MSQLPEISPEIQQSELYRRILGNQPLETSPRQFIPTQKLRLIILGLGLLLIVTAALYGLAKSQSNTDNQPSVISQSPPAPQTNSNPVQNFFGFGGLNSTTSQELTRESTQATLSRQGNLLIAGTASQNGFAWSGQILEGMVLSASDQRIRQEQPANADVYLVARGLDGRELNREGIPTQDGDFTIPFYAPIGTNSIQLIHEQNVLDQIFVETWQPQITINSMPNSINHKASFDVTGRILPLEKEVILEFRLINAHTHEVLDLNQSSLISTGEFSQKINLAPHTFVRNGRWELEASAHSFFHVTRAYSQPLTIVVN